MLRNSFCLFLLILVFYLGLFATELSSKHGRRLSGRNRRRLNRERSSGKKRNGGSAEKSNVTYDIKSGSTTTRIEADDVPYRPEISTLTTVTTSTWLASKISQSPPHFTSSASVTEKKMTSTDLVEPSEHEESDTTIRIKSGKIRGKSEEVEPGRSVFSFLGIPFAESPTGDKRFKPPEKIKNWEKTRDAYEYGNSCVQWRDQSFDSVIKDFRGTEMWNANTNVSEDCLFINVWTPKLPDGRSSGELETNHLAVMVWIYGGAFYSGTSSLNVYDGKWLAAYENVVVVSMNYRVGILGFLALDGEEITGNAGLFDQQMALQWVRDNIHKFGGDPKRVTLFGESAGAASISLQMMSEGSKGLFKNVILQSASALSPWAYLDKKEVQKRAEKLAEGLNCSRVTGNNSTSSDTVPDKKQILISCLRSADAQVLVDTEMLEYGIARFPNAAVVDGKFLKVLPHEASVENFWSNDINVMAGFNANEGNYFIVYSTVLNYNLTLNNTISNYEFKKGISVALKSMIDFETLSKVAQDVLKQSSYFIYTNGYRPISENLFALHSERRARTDEDARTKTFYRDRLDDMVGDINFVCPTITFLDKILERQTSLNHSKAKTYLYKFDHRSSQNPWPEWMGVMHGYEIEFVFGIPLNDSLGYSELEKEISRSMMRKWANFAKHGNPNYEDNSTEWHPYNLKSKSLFVIGERGRGVNSRSSLYSNKYSNQLTHCAFWREHFPILQQQMRDISCRNPYAQESGKGGTETRQPSFLLLNMLLLFAMLESFS